jgi:general secretion pathway protein G
MIRSKRQSSVVFPWEQKTSWLGSLGRARVRTFVIFGFVVGSLAWLRHREERAAAIRASRAAIDTASRAVFAFRGERQGACPKTWRDVVGAGYLRDVVNDGWGHPLRLVCPGRKDAKSFEVLSDGPDGLPYGLDRVE